MLPDPSSLCELLVSQTIKQSYGDTPMMTPTGIPTNATKVMWSIDFYFLRVHASTYTFTVHNNYSRCGSKSKTIEVHTLQ